MKKPKLKNSFKKNTFNIYLIVPNRSTYATQEHNEPLVYCLEKLIHKIVFGMRTTNLLSNTVA